MTTLYLGLAVVPLGSFLIGPAIGLVFAIVWVPLMAAACILAVPCWLIAAGLRRLGLVGAA